MHLGTYALQYEQEASGIRLSLKQQLSTWQSISISASQAQPQMLESESLEARYRDWHFLLKLPR